MLQFSVHNIQAYYQKRRTSLINFRLWRKKSNLKIPLDIILITVYSRLIILDLTNSIFQTCSFFLKGMTMMKVNSTRNFVYVCFNMSFTRCRIVSKQGTFGSRSMCGETHKRFFSFLFRFFFLRSRLFCNDY